MMALSSSSHMCGDCVTSTIGPGSSRCTSGTAAQPPGPHSACTNRANSGA